MNKIVSLGNGSGDTGYFWVKVGHAGLGFQVTGIIWIGFSKSQFQMESIFEI